MSAPLVVIFVRHTEGCKYAADETSKRCDCPKHLRWSYGGKQHRRSANSRTWTGAEETKRQILDQLAGVPVVAKTEVKSLEESVRLFLADKAVEGVSQKGRDQYQMILDRLRDYAERAGVFTVQGVSREFLTGYCATWEKLYPSTATRDLYIGKIGCFLRYCYHARWIERIPKLPTVTVDSRATEPLTNAEYTRLLSVVAGQKLRALIQLMRYSGLAVRDAATLERSEIQEDARGYYRVVTNRQKTGTHVSVPVPVAVALELLAVPNSNPAYVFWHGRGDGANFAAGYGAEISEAMERAGIPDVCHMKSHRLRDTFAVDLLGKGVPLEEVSKLLGHDSIRTTEKHYAKWVSGRQDRLDALVTGTW